MTTPRKRSATEPATAEQDVPEDQPVEPNQDLPESPPYPDQSLPEAPDESPADPQGNRGKSEEAHANAPGQQKRQDPNTYPDPDNPPRTP